MCHAREDIGCRGKGSESQWFTRDCLILISDESRTASAVVNSWQLHWDGCRIVRVEEGEVGNGGWGYDGWPIFGRQKNQNGVIECFNLNYNNFHLYLKV